MRNRISLHNALRSDLFKLETFKIWSIIIIFPFVCILLIFTSAMDYNAYKYFSQSSTIEQVVRMVGLFIILFLPLLISILTYNLNGFNTKTDSIDDNSLIPKYIRIFSSVSITLIINIICILTLLLLISVQLIFLTLFSGLELDMSIDIINKLMLYLLILPFLILPFIEFILLIQSFTKNIVFTFLLPLLACYIGNAIVISKQEFIIFSPINLPLSYLKPIFSPFDLHHANDLTIVTYVCVASILMFSILIVLRGIDKN